MQAGSPPAGRSLLLIFASRSFFGAIRPHDFVFRQPDTTCQETGEYQKDHFAVRRQGIPAPFPLLYEIGEEKLFQMVVQWTFIKTCCLDQLCCRCE